MQADETGANDRNRTDDLFITSELLYRLSYIGFSCPFTITPLSENSSCFPFFFPIPEIFHFFLCRKKSTPSRLTAPETATGILRFSAKIPLPAPFPPNCRNFSTHNSGCIFRFRRYSDAISPKSGVIQPCRSFSSISARW